MTTTHPTASSSVKPRAYLSHPAFSIALLWAASLAQGFCSSGGPVRYVCWLRGPVQLSLVAVRNLMLPTSYEPCSQPLGVLWMTLNSPWFTIRTSKFFQKACHDPLSFREAAPDSSHLSYTVLSATMHRHHASCRSGSLIIVSLNRSRGLFSADTLHAPD